MDANFQRLAVRRSDREQLLEVCRESGGLAQRAAECDVTVRTEQVQSVALVVAIVPRQPRRRRHDVRLQHLLVTMRDDLAERSRKRRTICLRIC